MDGLLSLCMIVKDEENYLGRALSGVAAGVDEIIVVDTGSTDKTKEVASKFTDKIFDYEWKDDFAAARNYSFSKASCRYAMWLDADDVITEENLSKLLTLRKRLEKNDLDVVLCRYDVGFDSNDKPTFTFFRERIIRVSDRFVWQGWVHECIVPSGKVTYDEFAVQHRRSDKPRGRRNLDIYQKNITAGGVLDGRNKFYYGRELFSNRLYTEAVAVLEEMINDYSAWEINKIEACKVLAECYLHKNDKRSALATLYRSFDFGPPRAKILCKIGEIFKNEKKWEQAIFWYSNALKCKDYSYFGDFDSPDFRSLIPLLDLTHCYYHNGETAKSLECHAAAEQIAPDNPSVVFNRDFFKSKNLLT